MQQAAFSLVLAGALLAVGCASDGELGENSSAADASTEEADGSLAEADAAPEEACFIATESCEASDECCGDLECGSTTIGQVCCGGEGVTCNTFEGEDCCGAFLCVDGQCQLPTQMFKPPFKCGERWTYSHHSAEVRRALDFVRDDGGTTGGSAVVASAGGIATRHFEAGGAGNYVSINHSNGWKTYYFHLSEFSVADGATVTQGQQIGLTGTTGASSGPHIHYEQLFNGVGQDIHFDGQAMTPYPGVYGQKSITSDNACP